MSVLPTLYLYNVVKACCLAYTLEWILQIVECFKQHSHQIKYNFKNVNLFKCRNCLRKAIEGICFHCQRESYNENFGYHWVRHLRNSLNYSTLQNYWHP